MRPKPTIILDDVIGNAFKIGVRAMTALKQDGATTEGMALFKRESGWNDVLKHPTDQTPTGVYEMLLETVKRWCHVQVAAESAIAS